MLNSHDVSMLKASTLFRDLPEDILMRIASHGVERARAPGDVVFNQGDIAQEVFVVLEGLVKLSTTSLSGDEIIVDVFSSGQSFAEALAFADREYPVTATVILGARLLAVPSAAIRAELRASPEVTNAILASAYTHLHRLVEQIERLKGDSSLKRTARFLLALAESAPDKIELPYRKSTIASLIGVKPETLSRNFKRLEDSGVRIAGNKVTIDDMDVLRALIFQA